MSGKPSDMTEAAQTLSAARSNVAGNPSEEEVREVRVLLVTMYTYTVPFCSSYRTLTPLRAAAVSSIALLLLWQ
jgi:hypothetical protein